MKAISIPTSGMSKIFRMDVEKSASCYNFSTLFANFAVTLSVISAATCLIGVAIESDLTLAIGAVAGMLSIYPQCTEKGGSK